MLTVGVEPAVCAAAIGGREIRVGQVSPGVEDSHDHALPAETLRPEVRRPDLREVRLRGGRVRHHRSRSDDGVRRHAEHLREGPERGDGGALAAMESEFEIQ